MFERGPASRLQMFRTAWISAPVLFLLNACTGVPQGWQEAKGATSAADPVSGAWAGEWHSETNGHSGGLRAVATRTGPDSWQFHYRASWAKILSAGFSMNATAKPDAAGHWAVSGSKNLGKALGGIFSCHGTIRGDAFSARYTSKMDQGTMMMRRTR